MDSTTDIPARPGPVRTCIGCRTRAAKAELMRVVAGSDAHGTTVVPDPDGTAHGRGAHLHPTAACFALAQRRRAFGRALRLTGGADASAVGAWIDALEENP
ncbi:YlxR family protein [Nocardioides sp. AE5]|uniref:YlxR family protein n=1 Tax=Nocardioides sp. AE5 TaxID=2962573 RepID=UPI0028821055|nr:YlxR family protein [Nocardioides sp. AE5]MDT0201133.1 YlxR family protein [Nocardioides sp. AE5]